MMMMWWWWWWWWWWWACEGRWNQLELSTESYGRCAIGSRRSSCATRTKPPPPPPSDGAITKVGAWDLRPPQTIRSWSPGGRGVRRRCPAATGLNRRNCVPRYLCPFPPPDADTPGVCAFPREPSSGPSDPPHEPFQSDKFAHMPTYLLPTDRRLTVRSMCSRSRSLHST
ncbi:hypothetical protein LZ30DRAFT_278058 [Colletotrichum cereale]|nr:hypothetical protein LZ30DRAFT_278058 [Colletotrichum cereale]